MSESEELLQLGSESYTVTGTDVGRQLHVELGRPGVLMRGVAAAAIGAQEQ